MCFPSNKVTKNDTKRFLAFGGLHEDKFIDAPSPEGRSLSLDEDDIELIVLIA